MAKDAPRAAVAQGDERAPVVIPDWVARFVGQQALAIEHMRMQLAAKSTSDDDAPGGGSA